MQTESPPRRLYRIVSAVVLVLLLGAGASAGLAAWKYHSWRSRMIAWDCVIVDRLCGGETEADRLLEQEFPGLDEGRMFDREAGRGQRDESLAGAQRVGAQLAGLAPAAVLLLPCQQLRDEGLHLVRLAQPLVEHDPQHQRLQRVVGRIPHYVGPGGELKLIGTQEWAGVRFWRLFRSPSVRF